MPTSFSINFIITMCLFLLQVPNILLPGCFQLLAALVPRHAQSRLADGLRATPDLSRRLTEHRHVCLLRLLHPYRLQGHRRLWGKANRPLCTIMYNWASSFRTTENKEMRFQTQTLLPGIVVVVPPPPTEFHCALTKDASYIEPLTEVLGNC